MFNVKFFRNNKDKIKPMGYCWENQRETWSQPYVTPINCFNSYHYSIMKPLNFRKRILISRDTREYGLWNPIYWRYKEAYVWSMQMLILIDCLKKQKTQNIDQSSKRHMSVNNSWP